MQAPANTSSGDLTPEIGITATPVIDLPDKFIYLVAKSQQTVGSNASHFAQILYKVDISSGAVVSSKVIGDTINQGSYTYVTSGAASTRRLGRAVALRVSPGASS